MFFRKAIILIFIFALPSACFAAGELIPFLESGDVNSRLNWVIVSEGFTAEQKTKFTREARSVVGDVLSKAPWSSYTDLINIFGVFVPSKDSGASKQCGDDDEKKETAFDAVYKFVDGDEGDCRFLVVNEGKVFNEVIPLAPYYDNIFVLVNDTRYGGSGGSVVTFSSGPNTVELALHELGHVIADLADEYTTPYHGYPAGDSEPNVTFKTKRDEIPWNMWIKKDTPIPTYTAGGGVIGLFEGARYLKKGIYRPKHTCRMRTLGVDFCEICKEAQVLSIYQYVMPIMDTLKSDMHDGVKTFSADIVGTTDRYKINWFLDGELLPENSKLIQIGKYNISSSEVHILRAVLEDTTNMVRREKLEFDREWELTYNETGLIASSLDGETVPIEWGAVLLFLFPVSIWTLNKQTQHFNT